MATFTVVYDACVLVPERLRDFLMNLAIVGLFRARWTADIHNEWVKAVLRMRPEIGRERLERTRDFMDTSTLDCLVTGYETLIEGLVLPDPDDRHVLAAAIRCGASSIVTFNGKDFPSAALQPFGIEAVHPDDFAVAQFDLNSVAVCHAARTHRKSLRRPPNSVDEYIHGIRRHGLPTTALRLSEFKDSI